MSAAYLRQRADNPRFIIEVLYYQLLSIATVTLPFVGDLVFEDSSIEH